MSVYKYDYAEASMKEQWSSKGRGALKCFTTWHIAKQNECMRKDGILSTPASAGSTGHLTTNLETRSCVVASRRATFAISITHFLQLSNQTPTTTAHQ